MRILYCFFVEGVIQMNTYILSGSVCLKEKTGSGRGLVKEAMDTLRIRGFLYVPKPVQKEREGI